MSVLNWLDMLFEDVRKICVQVESYKYVQSLFFGFRPFLLHVSLARKIPFAHVLCFAERLVCIAPRIRLTHQKKKKYFFCF